MVGWLLPSLRLFSSAAFASQAVLRRVVAHILQVALVEVTTLLRQEEIDQVVIALDALGTLEQQPLGLLALLRKHRVHRVLVETVDQLDKVVL